METRRDYIKADACLLCKKQRDPIQKNEHLEVDADREWSVLSSANASPGDIISMDLNGPVMAATDEGSQLIFLLQDVANFLQEVTAGSHAWNVSRLP